jgi:hypothetical protein
MGVSAYKLFCLPIFTFDHLNYAFTKLHLIIFRYLTYCCCYCAIERKRTTNLAIFQRLFQSIVGSIRRRPRRPFTWSRTSISQFMVCRWLFEIFSIYLLSSTHLFVRWSLYLVCQCLVRQVDRCRCAQLPSVITIGVFWDFCDLKWKMGRDDLDLIMYRPTFGANRVPYIIYNRRSCLI